MVVDVPMVCVVDFCTEAFKPKLPLTVFAILPAIFANAGPATIDAPISSAFPRLTSPPILTPFVLLVLSVVPNDKDFD